MADACGSLQHATDGIERLGKGLTNELLSTGKLNNGQPLEYAFGLFVDEHRGLKRVQHGGAFAGFRTEMTFSHWLGKVFQRTNYIDIIFSSGNGLCRVDEGWFEHSLAGEILEVPVWFCAVEEAIWLAADVLRS